MTCAKRKSLIAEVHKLSASGPPEVQTLLQNMIDRKRLMFGDYRYSFGRAEFYMTDDGELRCRAEATMPRESSREKVIRANGGRSSVAMARSMKRRRVMD